MASRTAGTAILMVHGFPLSGSLWRHLGNSVGGLPVLAPDLQGFGSRPFPAERHFSISQQADDLIAALDAAGFEKAIVCGLSMGGYIAFEIYRTHPDRVMALGLFSTRAEPDDEQGKAGRDEMMRLARRSGLAPIADAMVPRLVAPTAPPSVVAETRGVIVSASVGGVVAALEAMRDRSDSRPLLPGIRVPTMVLAGSDDQLIPVEASRAIAAGVAGSSLVIVPGAGHLVPIENPDSFGAAMNNFVRGVL